MFFLQTLRRARGNGGFNDDDFFAADFFHGVRHDGNVAGTVFRAPRRRHADENNLRLIYVVKAILPGIGVVEKRFSPRRKPLIS